MICSIHPENELVGYCSVCGDLGCNECFTVHEGEHICRRDFKAITKRTGMEFKSINEKVKEQERREKTLQRPDRQRLVIHRKSGETSFGVCFSMNLESNGFYADLCDLSGRLLDQRLFVSYEELKAVYYVKSFDGHFDRDQNYAQPHPVGAEIVVQFKDGEIIEGHIHGQFRTDARRFFLFPKDTRSNNISVLVESTAVERVYTPAEYQQKLTSDLQEYVEKHAIGGISRAEAAGDFHFRFRDYFLALQAYEHAMQETPDSVELIKKFAYTMYNIGAWHIHRHEYPQALECLQKAHEMEPKNTRIHVKMREVQRVIDKMREKRLRKSGAAT